jgi:uncharacterized sulfatase
VQQPNFIFIMTDTQGAHRVGAYGRPELRTPNLDHLAAEGVRFDHAYTTSPLCTPARAGLFSGIYSHTSGAWTNSLALGANIRHMGERFRRLGYDTAYIGKWHLDGHDYFGNGECPEGWDPAYWYDGRRYLDELTPEQTALWRRGLGSIEKLREHRITAEFTWAHRSSNRAMRFLERQPGKPFVLVVSYDEPHGPCVCPPEFVEPFLDYEYDVGPAAFDDLAAKPAHQREWAGARLNAKPTGRRKDPLFFGCNSFVDHEIGRVIAAAAPHAADTYVIYTSDHGDMGGAHRLSGKGPVMYEQITRIPLLIRGPGIAPGRVEPASVSHVDLLPTMLALAGETPLPALEGRRLDRHLIGGESLGEGEAIIEFNRYEICHDSWGGFQPIRCVVRGRLKLVINLLTSDELYDLADDPAELRNRIDDPAYTERRDRLHERLIEWMNDKRDPFRGPAWERRPWRRETRLAWNGLYRPNPDDGYAPEFRDYDTGRATIGVHKEFG